MAMIFSEKIKGIIELTFINKSPGLREYEYTLYPHIGGWEEGGVYNEAEKFNVPLTVLQTSAHNMGFLPMEQSVYSINAGNLIMSPFKKSEDRDSYIVRLFNPTDEKIEGQIKVFADIKKVYLTTLNEERISELKVEQQNMVKICALRNKIVTVELVI